VSTSLNASALRAPPHELALALLQRLPDKPFRRSELIRDLVSEVAPPRQQASGIVSVSHQNPLTDHPAEALLLATALAQLERDGLLVQWPPDDPRYTSSGFADVFTVTADGRRVRRLPNAREILAARRSFSAELHATLEARVRDDVSGGAFETAALKALRAVEARVRDLSREPRNQRGERMIGVALMQHAFSAATGPLTDPNAEPGEQVGTMQLFCGAFGAVRNLLAHTEHEFGDPTEAAEYVLLADLLMRLLDRAEARLKPHA
jgi:uncharacterized protein (TIGR02391 family)